MKPLAIVTCYNEADILPWTLAHLRLQGCEIHVIDNWSTDGSIEIARSHQPVAVERYPRTGPPPLWDWQGMLSRVAIVAEGWHGWVIHCDADEIMRPIRFFTLQEALSSVETRGFNAVGFRIYDFPPTDNGYIEDPEKYFRYYREDRVDSWRNTHVRAWISVGQRIHGFTESGGHVLDFSGMQIAPESWTLKHYPFRTLEQGARKLKERRERYSPKERAKGWHVQYNQIDSFRLADPEGLKLWPQQ